MRYVVRSPRNTNKLLSEREVTKPNVERSTPNAERLIQDFWVGGSTLNVGRFHPK